MVTNVRQRILFSPRKFTDHSSVLQTPFKAPAKRVVKPDRSDSSNKRISKCNGTPAHTAIYYHTSVFPSFPSKVSAATFKNNSEPLKMKDKRKSVQIRLPDLLQEVEKKQSRDKNRRLSFSRALMSMEDSKNLKSILRKKAICEKNESPEFLRETGLQAPTRRSLRSTSMSNLQGVNIELSHRPRNKSLGAIIPLSQIVKPRNETNKRIPNWLKASLLRKPKQPTTSEFHSVYGESLKLTGFGSLNSNVKDMQKDSIAEKVDRKTSISLHKKSIYPYKDPTLKTTLGSDERLQTDNLDLRRLASCDDNVAINSSKEKANKVSTLQNLDDNKRSLNIPAKEPETIVLRRFPRRQSITKYVTSDVDGKPVFGGKNVSFASAILTTSNLASMTESWNASIQNSQTSFVHLEDKRISFARRIASRAGLSPEKLIILKSVEKVQGWMKTLPKHFEVSSTTDLPPIQQT